MIYFIEFLASLFGHRRTFNRYLRPFTKSRQRRRIPNSTRALVLAQAGFKCQRCGSPHNLHVDHVVPHSWGGSDGIHNLQVLCAKCNRTKSNRSSADYR